MQRAFRLRRPVDFQRVRAGRRSWGHPLLVLYVAPNDGQPTRVGISVGKRVGKAVVSNRVKRRVREAVRLRHADLASGHDLVFIARAPAADADWPALRAATEDLLRRARVLPRDRSDGGHGVATDSPSRRPSGRARRDAPVRAEPAVDAPRSEPTPGRDASPTEERQAVPDPQDMAALPTSIPDGPASIEHGTALVAAPRAERTGAEHA